VKARQPFPGLSNALCDLAPTDEVGLAVPAAALRVDRAPGIPVPRPTSAEQRLHTRFDKAFLVVIGSELYGDCHAIARNISEGGVLVEMSYAPPLGSVMTVHFRHPREDGSFDEIVASAEVKHHHYLNFIGGNESDSARAVGMRFLEFLDVPGSETSLPH
jgi:hypothetical protein